MTMDPQAKALLDRMAAGGDGEGRGEPTIDEARAGFRGLAHLSGEPEAVQAIKDLSVPGPDGDGLPVRAYTRIVTAGEGDASGLPVVVFFHSGAFGMGDLDMYEAPCRALANRSGCLVASVGYRLAPEHPFPAAVEDAYAATRWLHEHAGEIGGDGRRLAVAGDSAGGTLAAVVALLAKERGGPPLAFQALIYPNTDATLSSASWDDFDGYVLTKDGMRWALEAYLQGSADPKDPRVSPLFAPDLGGLPPALVVTGGYDPLRDEGEAYARRLEEAGVAVNLSRYEGMIHGFFQMAAVLDKGDQLIDDVAAALRGALAVPSGRQHR